RDLRRFNRYCGGISIYKRMMRRAGDPQSILDIGTGTSDLLEAVKARIRVGLDIKIDHLLRGEDASIHKVIGDARRLPFRDGAFDAVTSAHFFHHFTPEENVDLLRESYRVAKRAVAV